MPKDSELERNARANAGRRGRLGKPANGAAEGGKKKMPSASQAKKINPPWDKVRRQYHILTRSTTGKKSIRRQNHFLEKALKARQKTETSHTRYLGSHVAEYTDTRDFSLLPRSHVFLRAIRAGLRATVRNRHDNSLTSRAERPIGENEQLVLDTGAGTVILTPGLGLSAATREKVAFVKHPALTKEASYAALAPHITSKVARRVLALANEVKPNALKVRNKYEVSQSSSDHPPTAMMVALLLISESQRTGQDKLLRACLRAIASEQYTAEDVFSGNTPAYPQAAAKKVSGVGGMDNMRRVVRAGVLPESTASILRSYMSGSSDDERGETGVDALDPSNQVRAYSHLIATEGQRAKRTLSKEAAEWTQERFDRSADLLEARGRSSLSIRPR